MDCHAQPTARRTAPICLAPPCSECRGPQFISSALAGCYVRLRQHGRAVLKCLLGLQLRPERPPQLFVEVSKCKPPHSNTPGNPLGCCLEFVVVMVIIAQITALHHCVSVQGVTQTVFSTAVSTTNPFVEGNEYEVSSPACTARAANCLAVSVFPDYRHLEFMHSTNTRFPHRGFAVREVRQAGDAAAARCLESSVRAAQNTTGCSRRSCVPANSAAQVGPQLQKVHGVAWHPVRLTQAGKLWFDDAYAASFPPPMPMPGFNRLHPDFLLLHPLLPMQSAG